MGKWMVKISLCALSVCLLVAGVAQADPLMSSLHFSDLSVHDSTDNTLNVASVTNGIAVVQAAAGDDYRYSVTYTNQDFDGDGTNDTLSFTLNVAAVIGSVADHGISIANTTTNGATATIGSTSVAVDADSAQLFTADGNMSDGKTLIFTMLGAYSSVGSVQFDGFDGLAYGETANSYGHGYVVGVGTGLFGETWNNSGSRSIASTDTLVTTSEQKIAPNSNPQRWGVQDVDFSFTVDMTPPIPEDFYVSTTGSDTNSGTLAEPFATIQHAVDGMGPGDTCYIRGGTYHEEINLAGVAGSATNPITLKNYNGEVVVLDGTAAITNSWTLDAGNIYKTTLAEDVTQLFVDGRIMTLARFPNAQVYSDEMWTTRTKKLAGSTRGNIVGEQIVADAGVSFEGCIGMFNFGNYETIMSYVSEHVAGTNVLKYSPTVGIWRTSDSYFFEGGVDDAERAMLDVAQEWAYDESTKTLYLWADDGLNPNGREIAGKVQKFAITGNASTKNIVIDGLDFFATTFQFISSDGITIQNCDSLYHTASDRAIGSNATPEPAQVVGTNDDYCEDLVLYNNTFRYSDTAALVCSYIEDSRVENNLFRDINYTCVISTAVQTSQTRNLIHRRNTIINAGPYAGFRFGRNAADENLQPFTLEYNYAEKCSRLQEDGTAYYSAGGGIVGSVWRYNWAYDNHEIDFRFDGANNPLTGVEANIYRNVALATTSKQVNQIGAAYKLKGDFHEIYNNIAVHPRGDFEVSIEKGGNANSQTYNNAADKLVGNDAGAAVPGIASNNFAGQNDLRRMIDTLRDPYNLDFRPKWDAVDFVDQGREVTCDINGENVDITAGYNGEAPDIGAYEYGDENYWIPGYQYPQASTPYPADRRTNALYDTDLMWLGGLGATNYTIYLGTASSSLALMGSQTNNIFTPAGGWTNDQTYYWRIDSVLADSSVVIGDVWTFTINDHAPRATSARYELAEEGSLAIELTGYDPDGLSLSYTVTQQPTHGTLTGTTSNRVYTPYADFFGEDSIRFEVDNGTTDSGRAIVIFDVTGVDNDAPYFHLNPFTKSTASKGVSYSNSIATSATDPDGQPLVYAALSGPSWLNIAANGTLNGTPAFADLGINAWEVAVTDPTGSNATATLEIRVVEGGLLALDFVDFDSSIMSNALTVGGSSSNLAVVGIADGNDFLYTVTYIGEDFDGDLLNDTLSFDVRVKGWDGGSTDAGIDVPGSTLTASATIGTTASSVSISASTFIVGDASMNNGESLEFLLENLTVSLTDPEKIGNATSTGFTSARLEQTASTANSHQAVFGSGTGLLGWDFNTHQESGTLDVGTGSLYISSDDGVGTRSTSWGVANVDFGIEVEIVSVGSYTAWASGYGLGGQNFLPFADPENGGIGDGYNNMVEYALGMNPTTSDAGSKESVGTAVDGGTNYFEYVHGRRTDYLAQGLNYLLIDSTNLVDSGLSTNTQNQIMVGPAVDGYEPVTNRYETDDPVKFIQLRIQQD